MKTATYLPEKRTKWEQKHKYSTEKWNKYLKTLFLLTKCKAKFLNKYSHSSGIFSHRFAYIYIKPNSWRANVKLILIIVPLKWKNLLHGNCGNLEPWNAFFFQMSLFSKLPFFLDILLNQISCGEFSGNWYRRVFNLMNPGGFQVWTTQHTPVQWDQVWLQCSGTKKCYQKCKIFSSFAFAWVSTFNPCSILYLFVICSFPFLCFQVYADRKKNDDKRVHQFVICFIFCTLVFLKSFILRPRRIVSPMMIFFLQMSFWLANSWLIAT